MRHVLIRCKKGFVILTIVFLTRIATVDMVSWDDTRIVPCDSQQYSAYGVATGTTEYATRTRSLLRYQISVICSKRALLVVPLQ